MNFLRTERDAFQKFLPGLAEKLKAIDFMARESSSPEVIELFRAAGGPGLLIPKKFSGFEASPLESVRIQRAIGSCAPSLAIATTMHHFSVATLLPVCAGGTGLEWVLLQAIARQRLLLASGFAEGVSGRSALQPAMRGQKVAQGILVSGSKKPCSLSRSMNLLTASVGVEDPESGAVRFAVALIAAESKGLERRPFWNNFVLTGAESDEIVLENVLVPDRLVFYPSEEMVENSTTGTGFLWFELLISASYLGIASGLVEKVILAKRGSSQDRVTMVSELEGAMAALENAADSLGVGACGSPELARALFVRYSVQRAIERASALAVEVLGGMAFVRSAETTYLYAAARALAFHPPSCLAATAGLDEYLSGGNLRME